MTPAETSVGDLVLWVVAITAALSLGANVWLIFSGPSRRLGVRIDRHAQRLDKHEIRLVSIEQHQKILPHKQEIHELELAMAGLKGEMMAMSQTMRGQLEIMQRLEAVVNRHDEHLHKR